jgi:hypothetical protein
VSPSGDVLWCDSETLRSNRQLLGPGGFEDLCQGLLGLFHLDVDNLHEACQDGVLEQLWLLIAGGELRRQSAGVLVCWSAARITR